MTTWTKNRLATPTLETLEDRLALSAMYVNGGYIYIDCRDQGGAAVVDYSKVGSSWYIRGTLNGYSLGSTPLGPAYHGIVFYGANGNDSFLNNTQLSSWAWGFGGEDTLIGGTSGDWLDGGDGSDHLYGRGGTDTLVGGYDTWGNWLEGGIGNDVLQGANGSDTLKGGAGNDTLMGMGGRDYLYGEADHDTLYGGIDGLSDYLNGGAGNDRFGIELGYAGGRQVNIDYPADYNYRSDHFFYYS